MSGIACPMCGGKTRVHRTNHRTNAIYRRRQCRKCGYRLTTYEKLAGVPVDSPVKCISIPVNDASIPELLENLQKRALESGLTLPDRENGQ